MKKIIFGPIFVLLSAVIPLSVMAESFVIDNYMVDMTINNDGSLGIKETINVQFSEPKHGVERVLPQRYSYDDTRDEIVDYSDIASNVTQSTYTEGSDLVLRLGDADRTVDGSQQYVISYIASPGVKQYSGWQELYWNLIGTEWGVPIRQVTFRVATPAGVDLTKLRSGDIQVVAGSNGSTGHAQTIIASNGIVGKTQNLGVNEGVTIGIKFNKNSFSKLLQGRFIDKGLPFECLLEPGDGALGSKFCKRNYYIHNNLFRGSIMAPIIDLINRNLLTFTFLGLLGLIFFGFMIRAYGIIRKTNIRKKEAKKDAIIQYHPPKNYLPHEGAMIIDNYFKNRHFVATLYDWSNRGLIKMNTQDPENITLNIINNDYKFESAFEQGLRKELFKKAQTISLVDLSLSAFMVDEYYDKLFNNKFYNQETRVINSEGIELYKYMIGYQEFIEKVEQDQLIFHLQEDPGYINHLIVWSIALGLDNIILKTLAPLIEQGLITINLEQDFEKIQAINHTIQNSISIQKNNQSIRESKNNTSSHSSRSSFGSSSRESRSSSGGGRGGGGGRSW